MIESLFAENVFIELAVILLFSTVIAAVGLFLHQPLIVSFLAAGILAGHSVFGLVHSEEQIAVLAEFGIALLLFVVGLKLDLGLIRTVGRVALVTGLGQVLFTSVIGFVMCLGLGFEPLPSAYIAVALTFSSTIIVVKLLSDKGEIDALHGRVALGFLIVQDIVVVLVMIGLSSMGVGDGDGDRSVILAWVLVVLKGGLFLAGIAVFMRLLADRVLRRLAHSPELLVLFAVTWAVTLASLSETMGFSKEMGAFLAGVSLASTHYREAIGARLVSLRDFLLLFFFIHLGSGLEMGLIGAQMWPAVWLSLFVLIGNPVIVLILMGVMGYRKRTGFLAGLTVAQISEFSLIFAALGLSLGHIGLEHVGLITLVGLITIGLSTYMIIYSQALYARLDPLLGLFERHNPVQEQALEDRLSENQTFDAIVIGLGRFGSNIARGLRQEGWTVLSIDFDPQMVRQARKQGHPVLFGDVTDPEFIRDLPLRPKQWIISAFRVRQEGAAGTNTVLTLLKTLKDQGYPGQIAVTAQQPSEVITYRGHGADLVLLPFADAARHAVAKLTRDTRDDAFRFLDMGGVPEAER
ncbi:cation:proton antiporter [Roseospira visakhapatnamensis]|uniref:Kef-type K+ transport system membrane component KefB n=1 Tax=Roseospira visakhapatnamensis TaxID=390880 RepID=A0A7W6WBC0_9PROT|nr:cation:proton antiporter family protein [Roseospira visakhapatnamensis]MBB4267678.1 Kef-type K+ transport system membrane component KefB [Roseospira visakhapatnamensis]